MIIGRLQLLRKLSQDIFNLKKKLESGRGDEEEKESMVMETERLLTSKEILTAEIKGIIGEFNTYNVIISPTRNPTDLATYNEYRYPTSKNFELAPAKTTPEQMFAYKSGPSVKLLREARSEEDVKYAIEELTELAKEFPPKLDFDPRREKEKVLEKIKALQSQIWELTELTMGPENIEKKETTIEDIMANIQSLNSSPVLSGNSAIH
jgi:hypothetical protein